VGICSPYRARPIGDDSIRDYVNSLVQNLISDEMAVEVYGAISDRVTSNNASHYGAVYYTPEDHGTAHVSVLARNGDAVLATSTINL
jgi:gamma-glutamyltranspeptidase/glutathione hydrolase/leukotriene-C4 hydrolase